MKHSWSDYTGDTGPDGDDATMAANVARLRKARGWSQDALATAMREAGQSNWRQTTVSRVENGGQRLTGADLLALQAVLGPEVIDGTAMAQAMATTFPAVRSAAARRALTEAEAALAQALAVVRGLRELYTDDGED